MANFTPQMLRDLLASPDPKDQELAKQLSDMEFSNENGRLANYPPPGAVPAATPAPSVVTVQPPTDVGGPPLERAPTPPPAAVQDPNAPLMTGGSQPVPIDLAGDPFAQAAYRRASYGPGDTTPVAPGTGSFQGDGSAKAQVGTPTTAGAPDQSIRVLDQMRQRDGSIFQLIEQDTPRGTVKTTRVVMPDSVNPYVAAQTKMEQAQANLKKTNAEIGKLNAPVARGVSPSEIVDPTDSTRMLRIDANTYKGGGLGSPGVIGVSGKEPTAATRDATRAGGMELLTSQLDGLRSAYNQLNTNRAIPSDQRGVASNTGAWIQSSTPGQMMGRMAGTQEQSLRNEIQSSRLLLLRGISQATGMSAKNLDSNTELKMWLSAVTDPSSSYESNMKILDNIEGFAKNAAAKKAVPTAAAAPGAPAPARDMGAVVDVGGVQYPVVQRNPDGSATIRDPRTGKTGTWRP